MAGDWIKIETVTPDKPEIHRLARTLGVTANEAFGLAFRLWAWIDANSVDGHVDAFVAEDVDAVVRCRGFAMAAAAVGWLDIDADGKTIGIPNFGHHNGQTAKTRALKTKRQQKWRRERDVPVDAPASTGASTGAYPREEKRREDISSSSSATRTHGAAPKSVAPPGDAQASGKSAAACDAAAAALSIWGKVDPADAAHWVAEHNPTRRQVMQALANVFAWRRLAAMGLAEPMKNYAGVLRNAMKDGRYARNSQVDECRRLRSTQAAARRKRSPPITDERRQILLDEALEDMTPSARREFEDLAPGRKAARAKAIVAERLTASAVS